MTTDWTPIRRRLTVRRTANRPPSRGRKAPVHRPIVAPLAATLATTVALGIGLALARSQRERHNPRQRRLDPRLGLAPYEPLAVGLRRMAAGQAELAIEMLAGPDSNGSVPDDKAVHETRKALKRLRALVRLLRHALGEATYAHENAVLRDTGRRLAGVRDAEVMVGTLDSLIAKQPRRLGRRHGALALRARLEAEHSRARGATVGDTVTRVEVLGELRAFRGRVERWTLPERPGLELVEADLARLYEQGRRRHRRAARLKGKEMVAMHEWRTRVKDLRYVCEMLQRRGHDKRLARVARSADDLGEALGQDHDLAVLEDHLRAGARWDGPETWRADRRTRALLLQATARRRRELRKRALRDGARLYGSRRKQFVRDVRKAYFDARR